MTEKIQERPEGDNEQQVDELCIRHYSDTTRKPGLSSGS